MNSVVTPKTRVVVTGMGAVTAYGVGAEPLIAGTGSGKNTIAPIHEFCTEGLPVRIASEVNSSLLDAPDSYVGKSARMAWVAAREALAAARLDPQTEPTALAAAVGWSPPPVSMLESSGFDDEQLEKWEQQLACRETQPGSSSLQLHQDLHCSGRLMADHAACSAGLHAVIHAARLIQSGRFDRCLAGASDSRAHPLGIIGYARLGVLNTVNNDTPERASRPFNVDREGFIIGEGAGFLVLESLQSAQRRGVPILGELGGWALANDANHLTDPMEDGSRAAACVLNCLTRAGCAPEEIDYLNAHGTATVNNDQMECAAYQSIWGSARSQPAISSTKSMIGHLSMASAAVESIVTLGAIRNNIIPPTLNLLEPDPVTRGLNIIGPTPVAKPVHFALKTAYGLGGQNAAVIWKKWMP